MWVGEDKNKVSNIVSGQLAEFAELYAPARESLSEYMEVTNGAGRQDVSPAARFYHLSMLPRELQVGGWVGGGFGPECTFLWSEVDSVF